MTEKADYLGRALNDLSEATERAMGEASSQPELDDLRALVLGKDGTMTGLLKQLGEVTAEERQELGGRLNRLRRLVDIWHGLRSGELRGEEPRGEVDDG